MYKSWCEGMSYRQVCPKVQNITTVQIFCSSTLLHPKLQKKLHLFSLNNLNFLLHTDYNKFMHKSKCRGMQVFQVLCIKTKNIHVLLWHLFFAHEKKKQKKLNIRYFFYFWFTVLPDYFLYFKPSQSGLWANQSAQCKPPDFLQAENSACLCVLNRSSGIC